MSNKKNSFNSRVKFFTKYLRKEYFLVDDGLNSLKVHGSQQSMRESMVVK